MTAYALAHLRTPTINPDVLQYIDRIQDTLDPYGGRFVVHGGDVEIVEGSWPGSIAIVVFPTITAARAWYASPAYQEILPQRTDHIPSDVILVEGVPADYDPRATAKLLAGSA
jgi:uncharacterized protein (DUF1330 family)